MALSFMKTNLRSLSMVGVAAMLLASCGPQLTSPSPTVSTQVSRGDGSLAGSIHAQVNSHRGAVGKPSVRRHPGLDRIAQQHSEFMRLNRGKFHGKSSNLSHYGFEERAMAAQHHLGMSAVAENIATCSGGFNSPATTLVEAWKKSSGHAKNMKGQWDVTGIGVVVDADGTVFATQIFASENHSHMALVDRMRQF
jgi:uncharacterized protein YkwD